jgi:hypothetical protein
MTRDPIIMSTGSVIDSKALTKAADKLAEAVKQTRYAYEFCPGAYTCTALQACLAAASAFDQYVDELAFAHSAEWLRRFPKIIEGGDAE